MYNKKYNDNLKLEDIKEYTIHKFLKPECKNVFEEFATDELFESIEIEQDVIDTLTKLNENHTLVFPTAGHPYTMRARDILLNKHLPFYKTKQLIMTHYKKLLKLDVLIDDCLDNFIDFNGVKLLVNKPWNRDNYNNLVLDRVYNWNQIADRINYLASL